MRLKSILVLSTALLAFGNSYAQTHVSTNGKKFTLLEEATGAWCGYCPEGAQIIEENIEPYGANANYPNAIIASFHNSHHTPYAPDDDMELTGDPFCSGSGYITGFPMGTVDRAVISGSVGQNRGAWPSDVAAQLALPPKFDIYMISTYDPATSKLTVSVKATCLVAGTGQWNANAYLTEDSISSGAAGNYTQHSYMYTTSSSWFYNLCAAPCTGYPCTSCAYLPAASYAHMNVVEKIFAAGGIWGDKIFTNPKVGDTASKTYTYTIPAKFVASNGSGVTSDYKKMKVIGFVQKYGTTTTDRAIENSIQAKVKTMIPSVLGISAVSADLDEVKVFPNPATNTISVNYTTGTPSATTIAIKNTVGQVVMEKSFPMGGNVFNESISLDNISNGIYFMTVECNGTSVTKQFSVIK